MHKAYSDHNAYETSSARRPATTLAIFWHRRRRRVSSVATSTHLQAPSIELTTNPGGKRARPYETVEPLAEDLGLTVDTHCDRDDSDCVADAVESYDGPGNILICWEHDALTDIVDALGDKDAPSYPDDHFDIIWTDPSPYSEIVSMTSEGCPGLDD